MVGKKLLLLMDLHRCVDGYIFTYKPLIFRRSQVLSSTRRRMKYHEEGIFLLFFFFSLHVIMDFLEKKKKTFSLHY
ncbi:hypothetical protein AHAS_Ahas09G0218600 [Arachis hypogaea]